MDIFYKTYPLATTLENKIAQCQEKLKSGYMTNQIQITWRVSSLQYIVVFFIDSISTFLISKKNF